MATNKIDELCDEGRAFATKLIEDIVRRSKTHEQMNDQLFVLKVGAIHMLAAMMFNDVHQLNTDPNQWYENIEESIWGEYNLFLNEADLDHVSINDDQGEKEDKGEPEPDKGFH